MPHDHKHLTKSYEQITSVINGSYFSHENISLSLHLRITKPSFTTINKFRSSSNVHRIPFHCFTSIINLALLHEANKAIVIITNKNMDKHTPLEK